MPPGTLSPSLNLFALKEYISAFFLGAVICLLFGTPCLLLIDKYFARFSLRYIVGGTLAGWVTWFFMVGPLLTPSPWLDASSWVLDGINHVGIYVGLGFTTGLLFTIVLRLVGVMSPVMSPPLK